MLFGRPKKYELHHTSTKRVFSRTSSRIKKGDKYNHKNKTKFRNMKIRDRFLAFDIFACVGLGNKNIEKVNGDDAYQCKRTIQQHCVPSSPMDSPMSLSDLNMFRSLDKYNEDNISNNRSRQISPMSSSLDLSGSSHIISSSYPCINENDLIVDKSKHNCLRPSPGYINGDLSFREKFKNLSNLSVKTLPVNLEELFSPNRKIRSKTFDECTSHKCPSRHKQSNVSVSNPEIQSRPLPPLPFTSSKNCEVKSIPKSKNSNGQAELVKIIDLTQSLKNKWISGLAITRKGELIVADSQDVHIFDEDGFHKRTLGNVKGDSRLSDPLDITILSNGSIAISDNAECALKLFSNKGNFIRTIPVSNVFNIACIASTENRHLLIASPDSRTIYKFDETGHLINCIPDRNNISSKAIFEHPYSLAVNPLSGAIVVGDDYKQRVIAVNSEGKILWRFSPVEDRLFFPSSISVDHLGYIFVADLCNEKVHMLDSGGKQIKQILSRGCGLRGAPGVIATDDHGHLYVADEERTIKVFKYSNGDYTFTRRFSSTKPNNSLSTVRENTLIHHEPHF